MQRWQDMCFERNAFCIEIQLRHKFNLEIRGNHQFIRKHCKNCECCPGHSLYCCIKWYGEGADLILQGNRSLSVSLSLPLSLSLSLSCLVKCQKGQKVTPVYTSSAVLFEEAEIKSDSVTE